MFESLATSGSSIPLLFLIAMIPIMIWETIWKGFGLWYAARDNKNVWFILILLLNTLGILPIIYIFLIRKPKKKK